MRKIANKKGASNGVMVMLLVLLTVGVVASLYFGLRQDVSGGGAVTTTGCNIAPSVNLLATDKLKTGTTVTLSSNASIYDGAYVGSVPSSPAVGKDLSILGVASNYLNQVQSIKTGCGANDVKFNMYAYAIAGIKVFDSSYNQLTDSATGGAVNQSSSANQITTRIELSGTPDKSTGDMLVIVEFANKTQVATNGISIAGATRVDTPSWYTVAGTGSSTASFTVPAIVNGGTKSYDLTLSPESGQTIGAVASATYVTIYALDPVVLDATKGVFQTEKTWVDSIGTDKTKANADYDFLVK
jgi:hypothetical protein